MNFGSSPSVKDEMKWKKAIQRRLLDSGHDGSSVRLLAVISLVVVLLLTLIFALNYSDNINNSVIQSIISDSSDSRVIAVIAKNNPKDAEGADVPMKTGPELEEIQLAVNSEDTLRQADSGDLPATNQNRVQTGDDEVQIAFQKASTSVPIVLFSKSFCPFCTEIKKILLPYNQNFDGEKVVSVIELDKDPDGRLLMDGIEQIVGRRSVPQTFISGEYFGGLRAVKEAEESGELKKLVEAARVAFKNSEPVLEE